MPLSGLGMKLLNLLNYILTHFHNAKQLPYKVGSKDSVVKDCASSQNSAICIFRHTCLFPSFDFQLG